MNETNNAMTVSISRSDSAEGGAPRMRECHAEAMWDRMRRCRALGRPSDAEVARMVEEFRARGGMTTTCEPAYLQPVQNGAGWDAERWAA